MVTSTEAQSQTRTTWQIDPGSTCIEFAIRHMLVSTVKGRFRGVQGAIVVDSESPAASTVEIEIDAATLDTGIAERDEYVRTEAFLNVEQLPTITFRSTRVEPLGDRRARVLGEMTICGVTREVALDSRMNGSAQTPFGTEVAGFEGRTTLTREDFGLTGNLPMPEGGFALGDTLVVELLIEAVKQA